MPIASRRIVGFHLDEEGYWVAELECGHNQHVRHNPPWINRPWVVTPEGRAEALNEALPCRKCSMSNARCRTICWTSLWNENRESTGLEHLLLRERQADSVILAFDEAHGPYRFTYRLAWDESWRLRDAELVVLTERSRRSLSLQTDGDGHWRGGDGGSIDDLEGCTDIDIWPTPFTNTFPIRRAPMAIGERRAFRMAWVAAPHLTVRPQRQAYTRLAERLYLFESLDGSGFRAELPVDEDDIVIDYPDLFHRVKHRAA
jgi:uncharacterized protein